MNTRRIVYSVVVILSLVIGAVGVYRQIDARKNPVRAGSSGPQRVLAPTPLTVSLSTPSVRRTAALGASTFLAVNAAGPVISEVRVYDGSALVGVRRLTPKARGRVSIQMEWTAVRTGVHVLHAEAIGERAAVVGHSAPLRLRAVPAVVVPRSVRLPGNGRTPAQVATASGVEPRALRYQSRAGKPVASPPMNRPLPDNVVATAPLNQISEDPPVSAGRAGAAGLRATVDGCRASITATDTTTVYEMTGGGVGFLRRGTATSKSPYMTGELTPGPHIFVGGVGDEPAASAPVSVQVPTTCLASTWSGSARLLDGELTLAKPQPRVWVYLGVDGRPFQRIPAQGTVSAAFGSADLAGELPTLHGSRVRMEVWRPGETASAPAVRVSQSTSMIADPDALADRLGDSPGVTLFGPGGPASVEMKATATSVTFDWQTQSALANGVVWQVLGRPLAAGDRNTAPPVLLATGYSKDGDGGGVLLSGGKGGRFKIPAGLLLGGRPPTTAGSGLLRQVPTPTVQQLVTPGSAFGTTPIKPPTADKIPTLGSGIVPVPIGDVYVRVLPMAEAAVVGEASNTVAVTLPELSETTAGFTVKKVTFDPGHGANWELSNCIRVTGTPKDVGGNQFLRYPVDKTYCPYDPEFSHKGGGCSGWCQISKDFGSLVSVIGRVWDYIAQAYNTVVDTLITLIAKFNPYCLTASVADALSDSPYATAASDGCEAVGEVVASVVVSVVLSSFGLPARLPTTAQIGDIVQGDLTALAVAYLEQLGVPCSQMTVDASTANAIDSAGVEVPAGIKTADGSVDVCAAMIGKAVAAIREQVKQAADAEVSNVSGLPVPQAPQQAELEPRGQYHGATVRVESTPIDPNTKLTARCRVVAQGRVPSWNVGGFEGTKDRHIGGGGGDVAYNPLSKLGFGPPWSAKIRMQAMDDLYDTETIAVTLSSPCFAEGSLPQVQPTQLEPRLGRWYLGEAD